MQHENQAENPQDQSFEQAADVQNEVGELTEAVAAESLEAQVAALEAKVAELQTALLYAKAEGENIRRRAADDVAAAHKYSVGKFAGELLVVKDCLEMALKDNSSVENIKMGVEMTLRNLVGAFDKFQIKDIDPQAGERLDPHKHQAMSAVEAEQEANAVVSVMQKGYLLADRVLRPAMVIVAKPKSEG
ncbi:nucleotide exchange factor GrpE [Chitinimonas sp. PSY-7]|uniref:nucleotide exchange factor GrpE n=1 Tax=Chitinimonas sp. PSY-7 TaxID=3459088 RepID=UPI00403FF2E6